MILKTECLFPKQREVIVESEDDDTVLTLSGRCPFCSGSQWIHLEKESQFACLGCGFQAKFKRPGNVVRLVDH
jgi:hypothetical protein